MQFGRFPLSGAVGTILAHGIRQGPLSFRKGRVLSAEDVAALQEAGLSDVTIAWLEPGDVGEDEAATRIGAALAGAGGSVRAGAAFTGRTNLYAREAGLALIDTAAIQEVNARDEAITVATLAPYAKVAKGQMLATIKIIPFAAHETSVSAVETRLRKAEPAIRVARFQPHQVALISTRLPGMKTALLDKSREALDARLKPLGSSIQFERRVPHEIGAVAEAIGAAAAAGTDPILLFGASAITDRRDVLPQALERAGGHVSVLGMPVDPGNLLMAGNLDGRIVLGLPGCARSIRLNGFDFALWRVLAGLPVGRAEISAMGVGGLLAESPARLQPREGTRETPRAPRIGAIILAAGRSSRMRAGGDGLNKLVQPLGGRPMIRHAVEAALASDASEVVVVTGSEQSGIEAALKDLPVKFVNNPDFAMGLSTSLICGLNAISADCDGALVLLGDMPAVDAGLLSRLIAAFDPVEGRAIIVPVHGGRRGNPVLWGRRFFPEMHELTGDAGARALFGLYPELICEVEAGSDAPFTDIDTKEALAAFSARLPT
jgi:molybdenum cofactor cytidylyltransferase